MKKKNLKNYSIQIIVILFVQLSIVSNLHPSYACTFPYDIGNGATCANAAFSNTLNNCYGGLIVSGSITGQTLSLSGLFKVNSNLTLNSCRIECNPGSGIEIMPGYTLTINNATYFTSCSGTGAMWAGIQVDGTSPGANLVVNNGIFEDAESAIYTLLSQNTFNITVDHAYFNRCCIWVEDNSPTVTPLNLTFFVRNNSVTGFRRCIDLIGLLRMQTKDNLNLQPVDVNLSCGIRELNCSYCSLFNNNVIGITSDLGNSRTVGYWIQTSSKCGTSCNAVSNVQRGFFYSGNSPDHSFVYNTMGACIDQFYLNSVTTGLHICNPGYPANNWFQTNSTCSGVHNTTGANSNIGGAHTYFWHNPPVGGPPINNMNTGIACQFPTTYMYLNQSPCGGNGSGGETSNRDLIDIASDSINWVPGTEEDRYAAMRYVYEILVNDSLLLDSLLSVHTKYDSLSNTNIARLDAVCRLISRLPLAYDSAQVAVIRNYNNSITPENEQEEYLKQVHELHLQLYEQSWILRADSSDYNSLAAIAALCPIIYGKGVYEARFLIAKLTGENLDYADDCIELENPNRFASNIPSSEEGKVTVYPNPAYDFITLQFDKYDEKNFQIFMKDITGRTVLLQNCKTIITSLNTKNLPRGVYLIEIKNENKIIFKGKQILQ